MKSPLIRVGCFCIALVSLLATGLGWAGGDEYAPGEVLVKYISDANPQAISALEQEHALVLLHDLGHLRVRHYKLPDRLSVEVAIEQLSSSPIVESAEPNYYRHLMAIPTDPHFSEQWSLHNTGQTVNGLTGPADIDIDWPEALDLFQSTAEVIVAVIDSGVAIDHPELFPNRWLNPGETDFTNGIDDDGNGYVDDRIGWDFSDGDSAPLDENGHGTLVASIIGAAIGNGEGGAGVAPNVKLMSLRILNQLAQGQGKIIDIVTFVLATSYAADKGARIINYSVGGGPPSTVEYDQIQWLDSAGVLLVAAAGNESVNNDTSTSPNYPSSYVADNIIAVAAIDRTGSLASFSNYGATSVDLAAPGTDIFGADVARDDVFLENFESGAAGWSQASNTPLIWSLYVDQFFNTWLTDSIDPVFSVPVPYEPNTDSWAMTPPIDLGSGVGARLEYDIVHEFELVFDVLIVEVSTDDGATWNLEGKAHTGLGADIGDGQRASVDLSGYAGNIIRVRFRLLSDGTNQFDGAYIDNVRVSQYSVFFYDGTQYQYKSGTSFAAPLVSGVAALLMAQRPDLTHREVRQLILDNVDVTTELAGMVATSGRLNAHAALAAAIASSTTNTAPIISGSPTTAAPVNSVYSFIPAATDSDGDTLLFSAINKPIWATFNATTGELSGIPSANDVGTTTGIVITVDDQQGETNSTASLPPFDLTVTSGGNNPPSFTSTPVTTATPNALYIYNVTSADPDSGDTLVVSATHLPSWLNFNDGRTGDGSATLSATPGTAMIGDHAVVLVVTDSGTPSLTATQSFRITVANANETPVLVAPIGGGGGGGCTLNASAREDPLLSLLTLFAICYLFATVRFRRFAVPSRAHQCLKPRVRNSPI